MFHIAALFWAALSSPPDRAIITIYPYNEDTVLEMDDEPIEAKTRYVVEPGELLITAKKPGHEIVKRTLQAYPNYTYLLRTSLLSHEEAKSIRLRRQIMMTTGIACAAVQALSSVIGIGLSAIGITNTGDGRGEKRRRLEVASYSSFGLSALSGGCAISMLAAMPYGKSDIWHQVPRAPR